MSVQYASICGYAQLSNDGGAVNKWALALMKSCCQPRCGSGTIRAPRGCSDRLCFCITLNQKVRGINLTLLWEIEESPLTRDNNTKQTNVCLSYSTCWKNTSPSRQGCQRGKFMGWMQNIITQYLFILSFAQREFATVDAKEEESRCSWPVDELFVLPEVVVAQWFDILRKCVW